MLLSKAKQIFNVKIRTMGGLKEPSDEELTELFNEALIYVATRCIPKELWKNADNLEDGEILRFIGGGDFIKVPEVPDFTLVDAHLQIDNDLEYAVINKAVSLYSRHRDSIIKFENEANSNINRYKSNFSKIKGKTT